MNSQRMMRIAVGTATAIIVVAVSIKALAPKSGESSGIGQPAVSLGDSTSRLRRIEVHQGEELLAAQRADGSWVLASRDGFPANEKALQGLVRGLVGLKKSQRMTAMPERHGELGLAWPDEAKQTRLVRIFAEGSEAPVAELLVGKTTHSPAGVFVRSVGDPQVWRCDGALDLGSEGGGWIAGPVSDLAADSLVAVECDGVRMLRGEGQWVIEGAPAAAPDQPDAAPSDPKSAAMKSTLPYLLSGLQPEDVRREAPEDASRPGAKVATVRVDGGHTVVARFWQEGDDLWVTLAQGECTGSPHATLEEFSPKWQGWVFKIPSWRAGQYKALFEPPTAPAQSSEPTKTEPLP